MLYPEAPESESPEIKLTTKPSSRSSTEYLVTVTIDFGTVTQKNTQTSSTEQSFSRRTLARR